MILRSSLRAITLVAKILASVVIAVVVASYVVPLPTTPDRDAATLLPPDARLVVVDGERTAIVDEGPRDAPAVVLVHGFGGSTFSWRLTVPALVAAGYRAVALDLPDFGLSDKRWDVDTGHAAQARFVLATMDLLALGRAVVVGHSMGGDVAAHVAMQAPARVAGLVLVDAAIREPGDGGPSLAGALLRVPPVVQVGRQLVRRLVSEDRLVSILRSAYADPAVVTPAVAEGYLAQIRTRDWDLALLATMRDMADSLPRPLASVGVPTLVVWGARDPWIPLATGQRLVREVPGARWAPIDGAGHLPFEERPDAFIAALLPFLQEVSAGSAGSAAARPPAPGLAAP